jgi:DNA (cytosine-5)-methyltransferase 1
MIAVDFFCGAGGLTRGLLDVGIKVVLGVDADARCRDTYEANNRPSVFLCEDIRTLSVATLKRQLGSTNRDDLLFVGCAPCQPFSQQTSAPRDRDGGTLLGAFGWLVSAFKPGLVFVENVPGLVRVRGNSTYRRFLATLERHGYDHDGRVADAKSYGVPQNRRRFLLIASRLGPVTLPDVTHGPNRLPYHTVRDAIAAYPRLKGGQTDERVPNHTAAALSPLNLSRLRHTPTDGGDRRSWPDNLVLECHKNDYDGHSDVYGRMAWDNPAPALTGRCHSISNGRYGHPSQHRAISLREAARLQSFDDSYVFYGSNKHIALQIGNAVPVRLAQTVGARCMEVWTAAVQTRGKRKSHSTKSPKGKKREGNGGRLQTSNATPRRLA